MASDFTFIREACGDDAELRHAVEQMLRVQESATIASSDRPRPVWKPSDGVQGASARSHPETEPQTERIEAGERIDDFRVIGKLGEGAMGVVYLAEQQNPRRQVALKLLRADAMSPTRERRFDFETESLARLHHPGIATIYKSGRADVGGVKRPFFAMEMVDGEPLDDHAKTLERRDLVKMMASICDAVEHAHRRGVLHRDLKPANILIGNDGRARVLDFGVATSTDIADRTSELVGTLPYMSPEQLRSEADIDGRADVYALGVILCEILTGRRPHNMVGLVIDAACDRVMQDPTIDTEQTGRELDAVIRRAIARDRDDRYPSAWEMRDDLLRHLDGRPVRAVGGGHAYRARKLIARNKTAAVLTGVAVVLAIAGVTGVAYQAARATTGWRQAELETERTAEALAQATAQQRRATSVNKFMIDMLVSADPEQTLGEQLTVVEMLDNASATLDRELQGFPESAAGVRMALSNTYRSLGRLEDALHHAERMVEICVTDLGEDHPLTSDARRTLALILTDFGRFEDAKVQLDLSAPVVEALGDPVESANLVGQYAHIAHGSGDHARSLELWSQSAEQLAQVRGENHKETLIALNNTAMALKDLGRLSEAENVMREVFERRITTFGPDHPQTLGSQDLLAGIIQKQGRDEEAAAMLEDVVEGRRRVLGPDHISTLASVGNLGATYLRLGRTEEAEPLVRAAYQGNLARFGEGHTKTLILAGNLAYLLEDLGRIDEAAALYRKTIETRKNSPGGLDPESWSTINNLAMLLMSNGDPEAAEPLFDELLAMCDAMLPEGHYYTALFRNNHAECLMMLGKLDEARDALDRSHPVLVRTFGEQHARTLKSQGRIERLDALQPMQ